MLAKLIANIYFKNIYPFQCMYMPIDFTVHVNIELIDVHIHIRVDKF